MLYKSSKETEWNNINDHMMVMMIIIFSWHSHIQTQEPYAVTNEKGLHGVLSSVMV